MKRLTVGRIFLYIGLALLAVIIGGGIFLYTSSGELVRKLAGTKGSEGVGRSFAIDGDIHIGWDWQEPFVHLNKIRLANAAQGVKDGSPANMVEIENLDFHIRPWNLLDGQLNLPDVTIDRPKILLEKYDAKNANWDFPALSSANAASSAAMPSSRDSFPVIGKLTIKDGELTYHDVPKKLKVTLSIDTADAGGGEKGDFKLAGQGTLQNKPFELKAQGGSLQMLRDSSANYPLNLHLKMGATVIDVDGTFKDPVKMEGVDTRLDLRGDNLADLYYLTAIPLPPSPPYSLSGHLTKAGTLWRFDDFKGKVGDSDLNGHLSYDIGGERGKTVAELTSRKLDMKDLGGFVGAAPGEKNQQSDPSKLLPDVPIDLSRLRSSDLDVSLKAEQILAPNLPIENMDVRFNLDNGVLKVDPLHFGVAKGRIDGALVLDGTGAVPKVKIELGLKRLSLAQFFTSPALASLANGHFGGRFDVAGSGKSLAEVLGDSDGRITMVMTGGSVSQLIVDAAGLDLGNAAPLVIDKDKPTDIRCAVADFGVKDGMLNSNLFVIDTTISNIAGDAHINLKNETIDAQVKALPKSPTITGHTAINIEGKLKKPSIGLDPTEVAARGGAAAVLSVFLTPLAAIIPFIELGVGEDSDCKALIQQAQSKSGQPPVPATP